MKAMFPDRRIAVKLRNNGLVEYDYPERIQETLYKSFRLTSLGRKIHQARYSLFNYSLCPFKGMYLPEGFMSQDGLWMLRFASALEEALDLFIVSLREKFVVGKSTFDVLEVHEEPLKEAEIFFAYPIVIFKRDVKEGGSVYMDWYDPDFSAGVKGGLANRYEFLTGEKIPEISFCFLKEPNKKLFYYKGRKLFGYTGEVVLDGHRKAKQFAQCVGLGRWPSAGMGMVI